MNDYNEINRGIPVAGHEKYKIFSASGVGDISYYGTDQSN
jgi:hypothetical protein